MEAHPLNLAHQQQRRADAHLINNKYDEAMQCHHNAAELLLDAMKSTTSSIALESITLQHSYHLKQKDLIKSKKEQYARVKKAMDHLKSLGKDPFLNFQGNEYSKLQVALYRAINENQSLLHILSKKGNTEQGLTRDLKDVVDGVNIEKSQETVVSELQSLNHNLHSLVEQLVLQVELLKDENMTLKERVHYLEKERVRYLSLPSPNNDFTYKSNFIANNIVFEGFAVDPVPAIPVTSGHPQNRHINMPLERPSHQPHFDLSALKND